MISIKNGLVIDEMSITPKHVYDSSTKIILKNIMFPNQEDIMHALTFILKDTATWWNVVGYFLSDSFDRAILKDIIFYIILKMEKIDLYVNHIISDMNPGNDKLLGKKLYTGCVIKIRTSFNLNFPPYCASAKRHSWRVSKPDASSKQL